MLTKKQVYNEIENNWNLNDNTTIGDIKNYYREITNNDNLTTGKKLDYLYNYILDSMLRDNDITIELYNELTKETI